MRTTESVSIRPFSDSARNTGSRPVSCCGMPNPYTHHSQETNWKYTSLASPPQTSSIHDIIACHGSGSPKHRWRRGRPPRQITALVAPTGNRPYVNENKAKMRIFGFPHFPLLTHRVCRNEPKTPRRISSLQTLNSVYVVSLVSDRAATPGNVTETFLLVACSLIFRRKCKRF